MRITTMENRINDLLLDANYHYAESSKEEYKAMACGLAYALELLERVKNGETLD